MLRLLIAGTLGLMLVAVSCRGQAVLTEPEGTPSQGPISVQPTIVDIATGDGVPKAITIELEDGSRLHLRLGESINLDDWDLEHLDGHRRTRTTLFVTYEERPSEFVVIELSE